MNLKSGADGRLKVVNSKSREIVVVTGILSTVVGLIAFYIWSDHNRYYIIPGSGGAAAYQIDRKTGQSWVISGNQKFELTVNEVGAVKAQAEKPEIKVEELPQKEVQDMITGTGSGSQYSGDFEVHLHNGTEWVITGFTIKLNLLDEDGKELWAGELDRGGIQLYPRNTGTFFLEYPQRKFDKTRWDVVHAYGYKYRGQ